MSQSNILNMPPFDEESGLVHVIVETPKGSRNKFKYEERYGIFMFDKALPIGQSFSFDFGFLPSTKGEDGDPLDALVLIDEPTFVGCFVLAKLLGVIEAEQTEGGETKRNDRFITVPTEVRSGKPPARSIVSLDPDLAKNLSGFFVAYNELQGKQFRVLQCAGPDRAMELIREGLSKPAKTKFSVIHRLRARSIQPAPRGGNHG
jgi:inorganic pyrophosphatase